MKDWKQPVSQSYPGLFCNVFKGKICVATAILLHMDHTLDEADVLMIFGDLEVQNCAL